MLNKKNKFIFLILFFTFSFSEESIAITTKSIGTVDYKKYSNDKSEKLKMGSELFNDDYIKTGKDGFVKFSYLDDGTTIKIHNNTEIYVRGKSDNKIINKRLNISNGTLKLDVSKQKEDEFTIVTPTSVASVKGTKFIIESNIDFGDKFYGFEGIVEIINKESNKLIKLSRNLKVSSSPNGDLISEIITPSDMDIINEIESTIDEIIIDDVDDSSLSPEVRELIILVKSPTGEQKEIIIKYTE
tara:strand:+ start:301 stop:1029 length:729 start_codon:yes stop_codon:yes gene_type:complete